MLHTQHPERIGNGRYVVHKLLGQGGMGRVYRAHDRLTDQAVALKQVNIDSATLQGADHAEFLAGLADEFATLAALRHPHIIEVLDYGFDAGSPYYTMTLMQDAQPFTAVIAPDDVEALANHTRALLDALAYLHRQNILHRDLKPANVLVSPGEGLRLLDFGLAVQDESGDVGAGTILYMAPELLRGARASFQTDLFALGVMLYETIVGEHPYDTMMLFGMQALEYDSETLLAHPLGEVVAGLIEPTPQERYPTARAVQQAIDDAMGLARSADTTTRESFIEAARFVGREVELGLLEKDLANIQRIADGHPAPKDRAVVTLLGGESGVGKTRLMKELRTRALVRGARTVSGSGRTNATRPYQLWASALAPLLLHTPIDDPDAALLQAIIPDAARLTERTLPPASERGTSQPDLFAAVLRLLRAQTAPLLILLEDLQWADEGSLRLLALLADLLAETPISIVANYRDDEAPDIPERVPAAAVLPLQRLSPLEVQMLTQSMLGEAHANVQDLVQRESEGNVFFVVEVVRALAEDAGSLDDVGQRTLPSLVMAQGIQRIVDRRLEQVPPRFTRLLNVAAVAGRIVDRALLLVIHRADHDDPAQAARELDTFLYAAAQAAVLEGAGTDWRFTHDKIREGVLARLSDDERRALHRAVAEGIEQTYAHQLDLYAAELAEHWQQAGDLSQESPYRYLSARQHKDAEAYRAALADAERLVAIEAWQYAADPQLHQANIFKLLGNTHHSMGDGAAAKQYLNQALPIYREYDDLDQIAQVLNALADLAIRDSEMDRAYEYMNEALALGPQLADRLQHGLILHHYGNLLFWTNRQDEALQQRQETLAFFRELGDPEYIGRALINLGIQYDMAGQYDLAEPTYDEAYEMCEAANYRQGMANVRLNQADMNRERGLPERAFALLDEVITITEEIGNYRFLTYAYAIYGEVYQDLKRFDEAFEAWQNVLHYALRTGEKVRIHRAYNGLGETAYLLGDFDGAMRYYAQAAEQLRTIHDGYDRKPTIRLIARALVTLGRFEQALALVGVLRAQPDPDYALDWLAADMQQAREALGDAAAADAEARGAAAGLDALLDEIFA